MIFFNFFANIQLVPFTNKKVSLREFVRQLEILHNSFFKIPSILNYFEL